MAAPICGLRYAQGIRHVFFHLHCWVEIYNRVAVQKQYNHQGGVNLMSVIGDGSMLRINVALGEVVTTATV